MHSGRRNKDNFRSSIFCTGKVQNRNFTIAKPSLLQDFQIDTIWY